MGKGCVCFLWRPFKKKVPASPVKIIRAAYLPGDFGGGAGTIPKSTACPEEANTSRATDKGGWGKGRGEHNVSEAGISIHLFGPEVTKLP